MVIFTNNLKKKYNSILKFVITYLENNSKYKNNYFFKEDNEQYYVNS